MSDVALVTGGAGFLGSHLSERLLRAGWSVVCVDNLSTGRIENIDEIRHVGPGHLTFIEADVCRPWSWLDQVPDFVSKKVSRVFHFASPASQPHYQRLSLETMWVNSLGLERALEFADQSGAHLTFASTSEIYGDPEVSPQTENYRGWVNTWGPRSCYDESKRFGETLIYNWNERFKTRHGAVRIFNTYGPRMNPIDGRVIINFLAQALSDQALTIYGDGKQSRSFCYVDDLISGILHFSDKRLNYPINLGSDSEFTISQLADLIKELFPGKNLQVEFRDLPLDDPKQRRPDLVLARQVLAPWEPKVPLKAGLIRMIEWLEKELEK